MLVDQATIPGLPPAGAERRERLDSPQKKRGARHESRDEQRAFNEYNEQWFSLRQNTGSRDSASGSLTSE